VSWSGREVESSEDLPPSTDSTCESTILRLDSAVDIRTDLSFLNLCSVRPSSLEVNTWAQLAGTNGSAWNWDSMFAAMKKSETFSPPTTEIAANFEIAYNADNHGTEGPLQYSYPGYLLPVVGEWTTVLNNIGVSVSPDPNGGNGWGAFIATSSINPTNL